MFNITPGEKLVLPRRRLVHKPVERRNLSKKLQGTVDTSRGDEYVWELKYDGCHMIIIKLDDGVVGAWSREGEPVKSCDHILREFDASYPPGSVVFSEAWDDKKEHPAISGDFRRHSPSENLVAIQFDYVTLDEFVAGRSDVPYRVRRVNLREVWSLGVSYQFSPRDLAVTMDFVAGIRKNGYVVALDGCIAAQRDGLWIAGDGKGGEKIKEKNHISVELRVVNVLPGEGKFSKVAGVLQCEDAAGKLHSVSCGTMTDVERDRVLREHHANTLLPAICEVHALAYTESGALREPRFSRWRPDKTETD